MNNLITIAPAVLLAATHLALQLLTKRREVPVNSDNKHTLHWISILGGISVSYVFLSLLPSIERNRKALDANSNVLAQGDYYFLIILFGFTLFNCLETLVKHHRKRKTRDILDNPLVDHIDELLPCKVVWIFVLHMVSYSLYTFSIGYLVISKYIFFGLTDMLFFWVAMEAHYIVDDISIHDNFGKTYDHFGRFILICTTIIGWVVGYSTEPSILVLSIISSFISGASIINVIKEELPAETKGSIPLFLVGVITYSVFIITF